MKYVAWFLTIVFGVPWVFFPGTPLQVAPTALFLTTVMLMGVFLAFVFDRTSGPEFAAAS